MSAAVNDHVIRAPPLRRTILSAPFLTVGLLTRAILSYPEIRATPNLPSARARRGNVRCVLCQSVAAARRRRPSRGGCGDRLSFFALCVLISGRDLRPTRRG